MLEEARREMIKQVAKNQKNGTNGNHAIKMNMNNKIIDMEIIRKEITNPLMRSFTEAMVDVIKRAQEYKIDKEQAVIEIQAYKLILASIALDWNKKRN